MKSPELFDLSGKVAIVTGGARGLGRQSALALAEAVADVCVCDILEEEGAAMCEDIEKTGKRSLFGRVDVTQTAEIESFVDRVVETFGKIDILVNNAGINIRGPILELSDEQWLSLIHN